MHKILLIALLSLLGIACFGLSTNVNSAQFTMDTVPPEISIIAPNGGEVWYIGDTNDILWTATDTNLTPDTIWLWYSLNGWVDFIELAGSQPNSGVYPWLMPDVQSYNCRVRIQAMDDFSNVTLKYSDAAFSIIYAQPLAPEGVNVDVSNGVDAIITWDPVTQTIYGTPITPDGYIVLYNESPYEHDEHFFYFLWNVTNGTSFTHPYVALFRDQMYYKVVAYKDYESRLSDILAAAQVDPDTKLTMEDIRTLFLADLGGEK